MPAHDEFLTLREAARDLRLSVSTLKRYIYAGQLRTYRTPGGSHRLRRADLAALVGAPPAEGTPRAQPIVGVLAEEVCQRIERVLSKRLDRIEMDVERVECSLDAIAAAVRQEPEHRSHTPDPRAPSDACDIRVLGPGCRACDRLAALVEEIARVLGIRSEAVTRVMELDEIAEYGPTPMPALVVNNRLVSAGRLPGKSRLAEILRSSLAN
jgi:excisionase family DNA binding protein